MSARTTDRTTEPDRLTMQSLHTLLEREEVERDTALAALIEARRRARAALFESEQLLACRAECGQRWSRRAAMHGAMDVVQRYDGVTRHLERAIAQQQRLTHHAHGQLERTHNEVQACEVRVAAARHLIERHQARQQRFP